MAASVQSGFEIARLSFVPLSTSRASRPNKNSLPQSLERIIFELTSIVYRFMVQMQRMILSKTNYTTHMQHAANKLLNQLESYHQFLQVRRNKRTVTTQSSGHDQTSNLRMPMNLLCVLRTAMDEQKLRRNLSFTNF